VAVRILDYRGRQTDRVAPGSPLTVEIDFDPHEAVPDAIFGVSLHADGDSTHCFDISTRGDGHWVGPLREPGTVSLHVDRLDLAGGLYHLDVGVHERGWSYPYDYIWEAMPLTITGPDAPVVLIPPHKWTIK
jgi:lipopolysaccharide transport system ATP-binding protein